MIATYRSRISGSNSTATDTTYRDDSTASAEYFNMLYYYVTTTNAPESPTPDVERYPHRELYVPLVLQSKLSFLPIQRILLHRRIAPRFWTGKNFHKRVI